MAKVYAHQVNITRTPDWNKSAKKSSLAIKKEGKTPKVSAKYAKEVEEFIDEHQDVLEALSKR